MLDPQDHGVKQSAPKKSPRFPALTMEALSEQQRTLAEEMLKISSAGLGGPFGVLLRSPEMAARRSCLMRYLRFETSVPLHLNELAVLIQARIHTAQYEWWAHYRHALKAGLPQAIANALQQGRRPAGMSADEEAVYQVCVELSLNHRVSDAAFAALERRFNPQQIVDLIIISGEYSSTSMLLNAAEAEVPNGEPDPLRFMTESELRAGLLP